MELTIEMCEEITGICNFPRSSNGDDGERRHHQRFPFGCRGTIWLVRKGAQGPPNTVLLRDISAGGVSFLHSEAVKVGTEFIIGFIGQKGQLIRVQCSAHRCEAGGTGGTQYVIGAVFQEMLAEEQEDAKPAPVETAPAERPAGRMFRRELPPQEAAPVAQAPAAVEEETAEEEPASQPEPIAEVEPEPVAAPVEVKTEPNAQAPIFSEEAVIMTLSETSSGTPSEHAHAGHNQEILARVKAAVTKQNQSLQTRLQQLEETNKQLTAQQAAMNDLSHKVQDLQGKLAQSVLQLNEERQKAAHATQQAEASVRELAELRQTVKTLQTKSEADDKAIAELAGFFGAESSGSQSAPRATAEAA